MGVITDITDFVGLTDTGAAERAAEAAKFEPYNVQTMFSGVQYDPESRTFMTNVPRELQGLAQGIQSEAAQSYFRSPTEQLQYDTMRTMMRPDETTMLRRRLLGDLGQIDPQQQLNLYREMAAPFEEQQRLNLENRLHSQGLLGASAVDQPGGARRSLFDAQAQADLMRQTQAMDWANQQRQAMLGQYGGLRGLDLARQQQALNTYGTLQGLELQRRGGLLSGMGTMQGLEMAPFNPAMGMGQLGAAGAQTGAQMMMQGNMATQNFLGSIIGGGIMGLGAGGAFSGLFGGKQP